MSEAEAKYETNKDPSNVDLGKMEVSGVVNIIDKDGNVKQSLEIVSLELAKELEDDANSRCTPEHDS